MTKQVYVILGVILIIVLVLAGAVFVREKRQESVEPITPPGTVTPTPPTPTPETRQPENSPNTPNTQTPQTPEGWKTYENKEFGFAFDYPGGWEVKELGPDIEIRRQNNFSFIIYLQTLNRKHSGDVSLEIRAHYTTSNEKGFLGENKIIKLPSGIEAYYVEGSMYEDFIMNILVSNIVLTFIAWKDETGSLIKMDIANTFRLIEKNN